LTLSDRVGPYVLNECIASGEAADVWMAARADGGLKVILKRLLPPWTERSSVRETFLEVIKDALPLRHAHIVPVLDFGEIENYCYVVFEMVDGLPLIAKLRGKEPFDPDTASRIASGVLRGLAFVHRAANPFTGGRLLHGDVSPVNVLVDRLGEARLADLGFARVVVEAGLPGKPSKPIPRYVAPEVLGGGALSAQSDVYGAGRIIEDLLPFFVEPLASRMAEVAACACSHDPEDRFSDAGAMLDAMGRDLPEDVKETSLDIGQERRSSTEIPEVAIDPATFLRRRYRILGEIGRGGMGVVYKVRDRTLDEVLAVKVLPLDRVVDASDVARFRRELTLARAVRHPNVARVDHLEEGPGFAYYTMEYVPGETLETIIEERAPVPMDQALTWARQLTAGLAAVHDAGIVHRDLKPANIVLTPEGRIVLMDFGIARHEDAESGLTTTGTSLGTPLYMAPEQAVGADLDHRADLYSLGVLLYELTAGVPPFDGTTTVALYLAKRGDQFRRLREVCPQASRKLDKLVADLLCYEPPDRPQDAHEVLARLA